MKYDPIKISIIMILALLALPTFAVRAENSQAILNQYIADLQKNPNDFTLREKIIRHVQTMNPAPAVSEEARRYFIEGNALLKAAKEQKGYGLAIDSYKQCLHIAPWWADAYNNYAFALELSGQFDEAVNALKLYIATNPGESETRKAKDKIYEIGAKKKIAANERAVSAPKQNTFEDLLRKIDGRRYTLRATDGATTLTIDVMGRSLVIGFIKSGAYRETKRIEITGQVTTVHYEKPKVLVNEWHVSGTFKISEDGNSITVRVLWNDGDTRDWTYLWQG